MARRANGRAVPVSGGVDALLEAIPKHNTRVVAIANPNDPTGELLDVAELKRLLAGLPEGVAMLLDESLIEFVDAQPIDASLALFEDCPGLFVFRSFSKAWGMAGLRIGYAIGGVGSEDLLSELEPDLGVNELSQAGALEALRTASDLLERHVRTVAVERSQLSSALRKRGIEVADSQANFLWVAHPTLDGGELAARLEQAGVLVASGGALGEPRYVRISVRNSAASDRLLRAIDATLPAAASSADAELASDDLPASDDQPRSASSADGAEPQPAKPD
jgi:histidinol-phosphate aminotransferase